MQFVQSKTSEHSVDGATRPLLLEKLQEKGLTPLIRSARLNCFELALLGPERVREMERAVASWTETEEGASYVRGDLFCVEDFALFLIFGSDEDELAGMRAGIVYSDETTEPTKKLDAFCRNVRDALEAARTEGREETSPQEFAGWEERERQVPRGIARFNAATEEDAPVSSRESTVERALALETLEDAATRRLLRRIGEAQSEGRAAELLDDEAGNSANQHLINKLSDVGLLRREMVISCRKQGRALFRVPSPDALSVLTASHALCNECGAAIADEKIEELVAPTELASDLLKDGSWLVNRLRAVLSRMGVPEKQVVVGKASGEGEAHLMVNLCGESFLFLLRDGDLAASHARRILDKLIDTEAEHLVVVVTGRVQDEGRVRLRDHARRRARSGIETEVIIVEGVEAVAGELQHAFERVSQRALAGELSELDASLGLSAGYMIATRFRLMQSTGALKDLAESAVGALAGSLREI